MSSVLILSRWASFHVPDPHLGDFRPHRGGKEDPCHRGIPASDQVPAYETGREEPEEDKKKNKKQGKTDLEAVLCFFFVGQPVCSRCKCLNPIRSSVPISHFNSYSVIVVSLRFLWLLVRSGRYILCCNF